MNQRTIRAIFGLDGWRVILASLECCFFVIQPEATLLLVRSMALHAVSLENGLDVPREIDRLCRCRWQFGDVHGLPLHAGSAHARHRQQPDEKALPRSFPEFICGQHQLSKMPRRAARVARASKAGPGIVTALFRTSCRSRPPASIPPIEGQTKRRICRLNRQFHGNLRLDSRLSVSNVPCFMKQFFCSLLAMAVGGTLFAADPKPAAPAQFKDNRDKTSYSLGVNIGTSMKMQGADINADEVASGLRDALAGTAKMTEQEVRETL